MERNYTPSKAKKHNRLCCFTRHFKLGPEDPSKERNYKRSMAKKHNRLRYRILCCFTRYFRLVPGDPPAQVRNLYAKYSEAESGQMTVGLLRNFMAEVQGESGATEEDAHMIMKKLKERWQLKLVHRDQVPWEAFSRYLMSDDLNPPIDGKIHHDMTSPLSHYFIFTGHNSYLTGNQLISDSSDEPIIKALERGVRAIELDIWPNKTKDDIDVFHGRTLTSPVKFIKCIESIKKHAFNASEYPVIITLEDHLTPELQSKVAKMITETFGDMLFYPDSADLTEFPSPEFLKHCIIISTKPPKKDIERKSSGKLESGFKEETKPPEDDPWGAEIPESEDMEDDEKREYNGEEDLDDEFEVPEEKAVEYKQLITIHNVKRKGSSLRDVLRVNSDYVKRISLSEPKLKKLAKLYPEHIVRFTQKNILRIYPKGTRVNSSNYNPTIGWTHGAQMVAFNMQGYGRNLWLDHGFFRANGGCGYVKKPEFFFSGTNQDDNNDQNIFNPMESRPPQKTLKVKVYMGDGWSQDFKKTHFDIYSPPDFYTRVGIAGVKADTKMERTRAIEDDWTPCWDQEFEFPLTVPELALLRIEVHEYDMSDKDDFAGQTCLPVAELKTGIRAVPLYNKKGEKYTHVKLLMRFEFH